MKSHSGFSLIELVIVLTIIAVMVVIVSPHANQSSESLEIDNQCREIVDTIKYTIRLADDTNRKVRFYLNPSRKSFYLKTSDDTGAFSLASGSIGRERFLNSNCNLIDLEGFELEGQCGYLEFDPLRSWPSGHFVIAGGNYRKTIAVESKTVTIKNQEDM